MNAFMTSEWRALGREYQPIWRKRVTIAGRSVPISLVALAVVTTIALAGFFSSILGSVEVATGGEQLVTLAAERAEPGSTNSGECSLGGAPAPGEFQLKSVGMFPGETCNFSIDAQADPNNTKSVFVGLVINTDASLVGIASLTDQTACGNLIAPGDTETVPFTVTLDLAAPQGAAVGAAALAIDFPLVTPSC